VLNPQVELNAGLIAPLSKSAQPAVTAGHDRSRERFEVRVGGTRQVLQISQVHVTSAA